MWANFLFVMFWIRRVISVISKYLRYLFELPRKNTICARLYSVAEQGDFRAFHNGYSRKGSSWSRKVGELWDTLINSSLSHPWRQWTRSDPFWLAINICSLSSILLFKWKTRWGISYALNPQNRRSPKKKFFFSGACKWFEALGNS